MIAIYLMWCFTNPVNPVILSKKYRKPVLPSA